MHCRFSIITTVRIDAQEERISYVDGRPYALRLVAPPEHSPDSSKAGKMPVSVTAAFVAGARRLSGFLFAPLHGPTQSIFGIHVWTLMIMNHAAKACSHLRFNSLN